MLTDEQTLKAMEIYRKMREILIGELEKTFTKKDLYFISFVLSGLMSAMAFSMINGDLKNKKEYLDHLNHVAKDMLDLGSQAIKSDETKAH